VTINTKLYQDANALRTETVECSWNHNSPWDW